MLRSLRDHYLRIDARSLGLFRVAFAILLIGDLLRRWRWLRAFYSNEGVLPNHNHLFNLIQRGTDQVWSVYHAFDAGEYLHPGDSPDISPADRYTRPQLLAIVAGASPE